LLVADTILGNSYHENSLKGKISFAKENNTLQRLFLSRTQMEKSHLRVETENGLEIGLSLEPGTVMHNGDVLEIDSHLIVVHQLPEKVIRVMIHENEWSPNLLVQLGHIIGNRHRPLSITSDGCIMFPIHDETEVELFKKLFSDIIDHLELIVEDEKYLFQIKRNENVP
jgi:Urease accessory protein UreE